MSIRFFQFAAALSLTLSLVDVATARQAEGDQAEPVSSTGAKAAAAEIGDYVIGPDDVLAVVFWREQELSGDVLVRPDGKISLPLLDDVTAAGLTPTKLRDRLVSEARRYVTNPIATVVVKQINSRKVYITGMVARPGQYPLTSSMTVLQLIATAGGLGRYANSKDIRLARIEQGKVINFRLNYEDMTKQKTHQNMELEPGDTVVVP